MFRLGKKKEKKGGPQPTPQPPQRPASATVSADADLKLHVKLTNIFREPLGSTPVYKDLPRLANRIKVTGELPKKHGDGAGPEDAVFEVWIKAELPADEQQRNTVRYWGDANYLTGVLSVREGPRGRVILLHLHNHDTGGLHQEPFAVVPVNNVATVRDSTRYFVLEVPVEGRRTTFMGIAFNARPTSAAFIKAIASAPLTRGSCIDLHEVAIKEQWARLLNAAGVTTSDLKDPTTRELILSTVKQTIRSQRGFDAVQAAAAAEAHQNSPVSGKLEQIRDAIVPVSLQLESQEQHNKNVAKLDEMVRANYKGDLPLVIEELFEQAVGTNSKTARVFKMIHQSVIFVPIIILKTTITKTDLITRDDNSPDGWRITIEFSEANITISHIRRELPLAVAKPDERQFWFEWKLTMVFDTEMLDLQSSELRVTHLQLDEGLNPRLKAYLQKVFNNGDLLVQS